MMIAGDFQIASQTQEMFAIGSSSFSIELCLLLRLRTGRASE